MRRKWLIYSESTGLVFCYVCKLFSSCHVSLTIGFNDWKNTQRLSEHEGSTTHKEHVSALCVVGRKTERVDKSLVAQIENEQDYWRNVLRRVVSVVKFLASRGLPFRGRDEKIGSNHIRNFLGIIELLAQYDAFLADHLHRFGNVGSGTPSYLSSGISNEFLQLMARQVWSTIVAEVSSAMYYSIIVVSTPDITHLDQLVFAVRYVNKTLVPVERFLKFIVIEGHDAEHLTNNVINILKNLETSINNCRGQSYDSASNMAGKYSGVQARIKNLNPIAHFIPCSAHSLNLVGSCAAECCVNAISFFGFVQNLYNFFVVSAHRWKLLTNSLGQESVVLKTLLITRWSEWWDAVRVQKTSNRQINFTLKNISNDNNETGQTCFEASSLATQMTKFEVAVLCVLWDRVLWQFHVASKTLQKESCDILTVVRLYSGLENFVKSLRDDYDSCEEEAKMLTDNHMFKDRRGPTRKRFLLEGIENEDNPRLTARDKFRVDTFAVILDSLRADLERRKQAYAGFHEKFQVFSSCVVSPLTRFVILL